MTKQNFTQKSNGDTLSASEWNELTSYINSVVDAVNAGGSAQPTGDASGVVSVNSKGNTTISAAKNINIEPAYDITGSTEGTYGDVQIKPGDDITLESHHRSTDKRDEITVKTSNGMSGNSKAPVKLQVIAADMTLSSKGKTGDDSNVMNVNVTTGSGKGYLKVRAQAIDLRCEEHGGIALQPKGTDGQGNMNKIKFEHGGGDGLEFGTFNTEKTSIFTGEYRFNRDGVWMMATRTKEVSDKADADDATTAFKYVKQADDFYDIISQNDEQCTTKDIIKTAFALNGAKDRHTKLTNKGAIEIATNDTYTVHIESETAEPTNISTIAKVAAEFDAVAEGEVFNEGDFNELPSTSTIYTNGTQYFSFVLVPANDIKIDSGAGLKLGGILDFGSSFNFGETDSGIEMQYKLTKKNATKDCGVLKVVGVNNHATNTLTVPNVVNPSDGTIADVTIAAGETATVTSCSVLDIINLVNYMKANNEGPWQSNA